MKTGWLLLALAGCCIQTEATFARENPSPAGRAAVLRYFRQVTSLTMQVNEDEAAEQGLTRWEPRMLGWSTGKWLKKLDRCTYTIHRLMLFARSMNVPPSCRQAQALLLKVLQVQDSRFHDECLLLQWTEGASRNHLSPKEKQRLFDYETFGTLSSAEGKLPTTDEKDGTDYLKAVTYSDQLTSRLSLLRVKFHIPDDYGNNWELFL